MSSQDENTHAKELDRSQSDEFVKTGGAALERLLEIMRRLRAPEDGCPWDLEQTFETIAPYTIEEAYEVADAIERKDMQDLRDELGDLLLQVVYHARIAEENAAFSFHDVVEAISDKMVRRHPHVFDGAESFDWESLKAAERAAKHTGEAATGASAPASALDGVALALPALSRAEKLQKRASKVGFDWNDPKAVMDKIVEEAGELAEVCDAGGDPDRLEDEFGDLLFVVVNLGRHLKVDPEQALRRTNRKFVRRFHAVEAGLAAQARTPSDASLEEMDALWDASKRAERAATSTKDEA